MLFVCVIQGENNQYFHENTLATVCIISCTTIEEVIAKVNQSTASVELVQ